MEDPCCDRLPPHGTDEVADLLERLAEDMALRWRQGEQAVVEEYLARYPEVARQPEAALELISEEIYLREEAGQPMAPADLLARFPQWRRQVQTLLGCHHLLAVPRLPAAGDVLGGFRLLSELGRGAHGRVFLAAQPALGDRPVVLKVGPRAGAEHLSLARLQHTHIVPLYSVHDFPARGLRALCMPYFGGAVLNRVLEALRDIPPHRRSGADVLRVLRETSTSLAAGGSACRFLARASYVQVICWIGVCLAEALHYAHEHGLLHLDLKPSNVLLAADGQPMLLDFHLAHEPLAAGAPAPAWLGGTPGRMAPEHEAAFTAACENRQVPAAVDGRADVYGLGLLLGEALGRGTPDSHQRQVRSPVTPALARLMDRCLAADPAGRYPSAQALADDLRRHLADLPLRGVPDRHPVERWRKWRRRRPHALPLLGLLLAGITAGSLLLAHAGRQVRKAEAALRQGEGLLQEQRCTEALDAFRHGIQLAEDLPFQTALTGLLREQIRRAERGQAAAELHQLAERLRPLYGADQLPEAQARAAEAHCRQFWDKRELILDLLKTESQPEAANQVRADLLDLAILWADLRVRQTDAGRAATAHREALELLDAAETLFGPSCVLCRERAGHARALGLTEQAQAAAQQEARLAPRTAWDYYALGRAYFRAGEFRRAAEQMERSLARQPQGLWANFCLGCCAGRLGEYEDAVAAFSVCVALAPQSAWCWCNRGLALLEAGRLDKALRDFDQALRLDPSLAAAALGRGTLHYRAQRYPEALADLRRALDLQLDTATVHYQLALVHLACDDGGAARASLRIALRQEPRHRLAQELLARLDAER
jgi:serine/threonine protein kinase/tetratricopeptide (TPR) repeat protein